MRFSFKNIARKSLSGSWFVLAAIACLVSPMAQAQFEVKHSFRPPLLPNGNAVYSRLIEDGDGFLYMATTIGGEFRSVPTISKLSKDESFFAGIYQFPEGSGHPMLASDGMLYVVTTHDQRIFRITRNGGNYQVLHRFNGSTTNGFNLTVPLTEGSDGMLYGTTESGGANAAGTVFRINKNASGFQVIKHLQTATGKTPRGVLLEGSNGLLYGTTWEGGINGKGVLFRLAKNGTDYTVLREFGGTGDGSNPIGTMVEISGQGLFGVTDDSIYRINLDGSGYQRLTVTNAAFRFSGGLIAAKDGKIYGEIAQAYSSFFEGGLFRVEPPSGLFEAIHLFTDFGEGHNPIGLIASSDGMLYGGLRNSQEGFGFLSGIIYQFDQTNKVYTDIAYLGQTNGQSEGRPESGITVDINGDFVGILNDVTNDVRKYFHVSGTDYSYSVGSMDRVFLPKDTLTLDSDGALYGAGLPTYEAPQGFPGGHTNGGIFCFDARGRYQQLYIFPELFTPNPEDSSPNGRDIQTGVIVGQDGYLYGTTVQGGSSAFGGVIYKIAKTGTNYIKLHDFGQAIGGSGVFAGNPMSKLYQAADGWLYGSTQHGGSHAQPGIIDANPTCGILYRLRPDGTSMQLLHDFAGSPTDGAFVCAELIQGSNGRLYGVAKSGGQYTNGVIFSLNVDGSDYQVLHHFNDALEEGKHPTAALVWVEGYGLYGITSEGGLAGIGGGTIFEIQPDGSGFTVLHKFAPGSENGVKPLHKLVVGRDKLLYGTTQAGGDWNYGTFFRFDPGFLRVSQVTQAGQELTLHLKGKPNESYHLERSSSLGVGADWQDAGISGQLSAAGEAQVNTTTSSETGFYRIVRE